MTKTEQETMRAAFLHEYPMKPTTQHEQDIQDAGYVDWCTAWQAATAAAVGDNLPARIEAAHKRLDMAKGIHSDWYDGKRRDPEQCLEEIEHIIFSAKCYLDGKPGKFLAAAPKASQGGDNKAEQAAKIASAVVISQAIRSTL